jgi:hypothetical protein
MYQYMRKSITTLVFVLASGFAGGVLAQAKPAAPSVDKGPIQLKADAPDRYVVVPGDTLWSISERYTDSPLRWPELWRINQDDIRNPHRIYPGNVIVLDRIRGTLSISGTQRLTPKVRPEPSDMNAIPSIPAAIIEPFLVRPLVVEVDGLDRAPQIVAAEDRRVIIGAGNRAVVTGLGSSREETWHIYQRGKALVDPDTKLTLGYEAIFLGTARVVSPGDPATVEILSAVREISIGDRLVPAGRPQIITYLPRAPKGPLQGRVMSIYGGLGTISEGGPQSIVTLNRGRADGIEVGHVLALHRIGENVVVPAAMRDDPRRTIKLPDERYGLVFVFRTFERVSYAMVMRVSKPVFTLDAVRTP